MLVRTKNNLWQKRRESLYEQEVTQILYKITPKNSLPFFSLSYCQLSTGGENLKIYLTFLHSEKDQPELLKLINKKYPPLIKKAMAKSKKFNYIPTIVFLYDKSWEESNELKKIYKKLVWKAEK
jgi:ribosome-binding factor A